MGAAPILSSDMLEGLLRQPSTEQGTGQGVVVQRGRIQSEGTGTRDQHIVQLGRGKLVEVHTYLEGGPDSCIGDFGPWIAWDRLYFVYLQLSV